MINEYWFKLVFKDLLFVNFREMFFFCLFVDFIVELYDNIKNNKKLFKEVYDIFMKLYLILFLKKLFVFCIFVW